MAAEHLSSLFILNTVRPVSGLAAWTWVLEFKLVQHSTHVCVLSFMTVQA
jgi:hypothetical protein